MENPEKLETLDTQDDVKQNKKQHNTTLLAFRQNIKNDVSEPSYEHLNWSNNNGLPKFVLLLQTVVYWCLQPHWRIVHAYSGWGLVLQYIVDIEKWGRNAITDVTTFVSCSNSMEYK